MDNKILLLENPILKYFAYAHLPPKLQDVSARICLIAFELASMVPPGAERNAGLRKLLEAKDCFVRAALENKDS